MAKSRGPTWTPRPEDFERAIQEQNPWHTTGKVPEVWAHKIERPLAKQLWKRLQKDAPRRYQIILGPRRVGKTTVMYQTVRSLLSAGIPATRLWWLRLDHPLLMEIPLGDLVREITANATAKEPAYLFLDELNYSSRWDLWLKTFYDENWPIRVAATSSSTAALRQGLMESGVGRWEEQYLPPYVFTEYLELVGRPVSVPIGSSLEETIRNCCREPMPMGDLATLRRRYVLTGGFPELLLSTHDIPPDDESALLQSQRTLRSDAVERAIYKDIPQAFGVDNPMLLERLLYTLAGQPAGVLSPSNICQTVGGLSQPTFDKYLSYLERAFLVFTLANYSGTEAAVQKRGRKLYFVDGAVRNAALQRGVGPLRDPAEMGLLAENMVAGQLHALAQHTGVRLYHWRDKNEEIDLVYDHPEMPVCFEIGSNSSHHREGIRAFQERYKSFRRRGYLVTPDSLPVDASRRADGTGSLPIDMLLVAASAQAEAALAKRLVA